MPLGFYIGTYTGHGSAGIYHSHIDPASGELAPPALAGKTDNPSFLALHPNGNFLYAVNENSPGSVSAFAVDDGDAGLTPLNRQPSEGGGPCHLSVDPTGACLLVANYGTGSFASFPIGADGSLGPAGAMHQDVGRGPVPDRQDGPHCHGIWPIPTASANYALGCDLGTDQLRLFRLDAGTAKITPADPPYFTLPPGTGPRHIAWSRDNRFLFLIAELANTISVLAADGLHFDIVQSLSTVPPGFKGKNKAAEVVVHPTANILYATNRGADDLITYSLDPSTGQLRELHRLPTGGSNPRDFAVDPTGNWLLVANEYSNCINGFALDPTTKLPRRTAHTLAVSAPVCIVFAE